MSIQPSDELRSFHRFLGDKLTNGGADCSPEEALDEYRRLHPGCETFDEDLAATAEALADRDKGDRGITFDEFDRDFRKRHHLPANP
jgi:hypothetical protein